MSPNYLRPNRFVQWFGRTVLSQLGWKIEGDLPRLDKYIAIVGYHTSNWDFVVLMAAKLLLRLRARWYGKHTLFQWPLLGRIFRLWGGIPIERDKNKGVVEQAIEAFEQHDYFILALSPEGTRSLTRSWKRGFHHIAKGAGVPILPVALDFQSKRLVIGDAELTEESFDDEVDKLHGFYRQFEPCKPENAWRGNQR